MNNVQILKWRAIGTFCVVLLGGCGESATAPAESQPVVNLYNWFDDINPNALAEFTQATGIKVVHDVYDSTEVLEGKLLAGHSDYDVVMPSGAELGKLGTAGLLLEVDRSRLHNYGGLDPFVLTQLAKLDPGNRYGVPYSWGTNGLGMDADKIAARMSDAPLDSWSLLFDPAIARRFQDCGIALLDSPGDIVPVVLIYLGRNPASEDYGDLDAAIAVLAGIQPLVRYFHSSQVFDDFANGEVCLAFGWSGSLYQALRVDRHRNLRYVIPKEGTMMWFEAMAIPKDAPHVDAAYRLIDHLLDPHVAAGFTNAINYPSAVVAATEFVDGGLREEMAVYPPPAVMKRLFADSLVTPAYERKRLRLWTSMKAGDLSQPSP